jgi:hypothetical protein
VEELCVGKVYLRTFLEGGDSFVQHYENPVRFFDLLMRRVLVNFATQPSMASICCQCLGRLYQLHHLTIGIFDDMNEIVKLVTRSLSREVRHALLCLLQNMSIVEENTEQLLNDETVTLLSDIASFAHTNPKSIGTKLERQMQAGYSGYGGVAMITNGTPMSPKGVPPPASAAPAASSSSSSPSSSTVPDATATGLEAKSTDETLTEKFDEDDSVAPRTWYTAPAVCDIPPPPDKVDGPYRISELRQMLKDGLLDGERSLVASGFSESYVDEDGASIQVNATSSS